LALEFIFLVTSQSLAKNKMYALGAFFYCLIILTSSTARYKWERSAQFLLLAHAIEYCEGHFLGKVFTAPLIFYGILAALVEWAQRHHEKASEHMFVTWQQLEQSREQSNVRALFELMVQRPNLKDDKIIGSQWANTLRQE
jgi:hypothetical protein